MNVEEKIMSASDSLGLSCDPPKIDEVLQGIDHAIEALYPYTQFHHVCHGAYMKVIGGEMTKEEEETLKKLGLKF